MDPFGRTIDYLRISVTDRCNERCLYCMPEGYKGWAQKADHLTTDELVRVVAAATELGFRKFRLTGGEPLLRPDIVEIARRIWELPGTQTLGLSTNGLRLATHAHLLKQAGVRSINVSLDALSPEVYRRITGGNISHVLDGLTAAQDAGFEVIKLNCVLMRGINEEEIWPIVEFAAVRQMPVRFIELMPLSRTDVLNESNFLSIQDVMQSLSRRDTLEPLLDYRPGHGPAHYYILKSLRARVGFIGALTNPHFCETCNKLRLTSDGRLRPCLGRHGEIDLLSSLRKGGNLQEKFREAIGNKPENHEFSDSYEPGRPMTAIGG